MRQEIYVFIAISSIAATIFTVALIELFFAVRRRKVHEAIQEHVRSMKKEYTESINRTVLDGEEQIIATETSKAELLQVKETEKAQLTQSFEIRMQELENQKEAELARAKAKAKKLEEEAQQKAEEYLADRKAEVERELVGLVMQVSKKVLHTDLTYELHRDAVMQALRDAKLERVVR
jgi:flagellar biosynthesis/type III secretory pathway protein FliH